MVMEARHIEPTSLDAEQQWMRVDLDLYEVLRDGRVVGYVEVAGNVFVALSGDRYDRAEEVRQVLNFTEAVAVLRTLSAGPDAAQPTSV